MRRWAALMLLAPAVVLADCPSVAVPLSITQPTQMTDGSPVVALCCNNVYRGVKSDGSDLTYVAQIMPVGSVWTETAKLAPGVYYYAVSVITQETTARASAYSNIVCRTVAQALPMAPVVK